MKEKHKWEITIFIIGCIMGFFSAQRFLGVRISNMFTLFLHIAFSLIAGALFLSGFEEGYKKGLPQWLKRKGFLPKKPHAEWTWKDWAKVIDLIAVLLFFYILLILIIVFLGR